VFRYCTRGSAAGSNADQVTSYDDKQSGSLVGDAHKVEERKKHAHLTDVEWGAVDPFKRSKDHKIKQLARLSLCYEART